MEMNKICTSIEQSKKLIELGIDASTADMCWCSRKLQWGEIAETIIAYPMLPNEEKSGGYEYSPAWSLNALLDIMPNKYALDKVNNEYFITHTLGGKQERFDNPLDAAFEMICWLKENGKI